MDDPIVLLEVDQRERDERGWRGDQSVDPLVDFDIAALEPFPRPPEPGSLYEFEESLVEVHVFDVRELGALPEVEETERETRGQGVARSALVVFVEGDGLDLLQEDFTLVFLGGAVQVHPHAHHGRALNFPIDLDLSVLLVIEFQVQVEGLQDRLLELHLVGIHFGNGQPEDRRYDPRVIAFAQVEVDIGGCEAVQVPSQSQREQKPRLLEVLHFSFLEIDPGSLVFAIQALELRFFDPEPRGDAVVEERPVGFGKVRRRLGVEYKFERHRLPPHRADKTDFRDVDLLGDCDPGGVQVQRASAHKTAQPLVHRHVQELLQFLFDLIALQFVVLQNYLSALLGNLHGLGALEVGVDLSEQLIIFAVVQIFVEIEPQHLPNTLHIEFPVAGIGVAVAALALPLLVELQHTFLIILE